MRYDEEPAPRATGAQVSRKVPKSKDIDYDETLARSGESLQSGDAPADLPQAGRQTRVAVVEDHEILRQGLVACLADEPGIEVTVPGADGPLAEQVDIAVVSNQAASRRRFPCPIVVCTAHPGGPRDVAEGNDVAGVVHQQSVTVAQLHATVRAAAAGLRVVPNDQSNSSRDRLDPRSLRVIELVADGRSTREIADDMSYSEQTIKKLITGLEARLGARSRAHMVAVAIRRGIL